MSDASDREIHLTRLFDAPRELVFKAWTTPKHIQTWMGPNGFTTTTKSINITLGGAWLYTMHGPDGTDYPNRIVFKEIRRPERIVYMHDTGNDAPDDPQRFEVTVTFTDEDRGKKTRLDFRMRFASAEQKQTVIKFGAIELGNQTMSKLGAELETMRDAVGWVSFTRTLDAPRAVVFKAWTDPKHLAKWWGPRKFTAPVCEIDLRPGGAIKIIMRGPDGTEILCKGEVREAKAPERYVFTNVAATMDGEHLAEGLTTVTLTEEGGKTKMTVDSRSVLVKDGWEAAIAGMNEGWSQSLDKLGEYVPQA